MLQHILIDKVLQCTSFLSKSLILVEISNNDEVLKLVFDTGINRTLCFTRKQRTIRGFTHVFLLGNICISKSSAFEVVCLNPHVLQTALSVLNNLRGDKIYNENKYVTFTSVVLGSFFQKHIAITLFLWLA